MADATNTTNPSALRALAARCEQFTPNRTLDRAIAEAVGDLRKGIKHYTSSLDAAVTLVPKEFAWSVEDVGKAFFAQVWLRDKRGRIDHYAQSPSAASALSAAALRARAAA